jgi:hypothetical protein
MLDGIQSMTFLQLEFLPDWPRFKRQVLRVKFRLRYHGNPELLLFSSSVAGNLKILPNH